MSSDGTESSRTVVGSTPLADELVDDRELTPGDPDRFRHEDIVAQLADLVTHVQTPANVALFGAWGSGKTGIANLLERRLKEPQFSNEKGKLPRFVKFDAFKYAELPLRRHFLSQLADRLLAEGEATKLRDRLYKTEEHTDFTFRAPDVAKALKVFLAILLAALLSTMLAIAAGAGIGTWLWDGAFSDRFGSYVAGVLGFAFAPAAVIGGLFAIAGKSLPAVRKTETPSSDEQFEDEFRKLLDKLDHARLIVFIDELDRCPADRVVDVLDTVRTFLDTGDTVFVVAADQHVLEHALSEKVKQSTPGDVTNPYYSSGSAYLDKVFHYQMSLPSLLPGRLTRFAIDLVDGKPGLWQQIDVPWVISVLLPTHVRSPRRVKTLINNFVLSYRLAERRHAAGQLPGWNAERAVELAKLVCLRTEFPLFARELTVTNRLPELVLLRLTSGVDGKPTGVSKTAWDLAEGFADGTLSPGLMLHDGEDSEDDGDDDHGQTGPDTPEGALRRQLHHYLTKTAEIADPHRDLIFLEAHAAIFGVDESVAEQVEDAAVNGRPRDVIAAVDGMTTDEQAAVVRMLAQFTRDALPGVEGTNMVTALLKVAESRSDEVLDLCADAALDALGTQRGQANLNEADLVGAFRLAMRSRRPSSNTLVQAVLDRPEVTSSPEIGAGIIENAAGLSRSFDERLAEIVRVLLCTESSASAVKGVAAMEEARQESITDKTCAGLAEKLAELSDVDVDAEDEPTLAADDIEAAVTEALTASTSYDMPYFSQRFLAAVYRSGVESLAAAADVHVTDVVSTVTEDALIVAVLKRARKVPLQRAATMVGKIELAYEDEKVELDRLVVDLVERRKELGDDYDSHDAGFLELLSAVSGVPLDDETPTSSDLLTEANNVLHASLSELGTTLRQNAPAAFAEMDRCRRFVEAHLVDGGFLAGASLAALGQRYALGATPQLPAPDEAVRAEMRVRAEWWASRAPGQATDMIVEAVKSSPWLGSPAAESLAIVLAAPSGVSPPYPPGEVAKLAEAYGSHAGDGIRAWLTTYADDPEEMFEVIRHFVAAGRYGEISNAVQAAADRLGQNGAIAVADLELASAMDGQRDVEQRLLSDVDWRETDDARGADVVKRHFAGATNNKHRAAVLDVWHALDPARDSVRRDLIETVLLPGITDGGRGALDLALARPALWRAAPNCKTAVKKAFREAAGKKNDDRVEKLLRQNGVVRREPKALGLLGSREVDED